MNKTILILAAALLGMNHRAQAATVVTATDLGYAYSGRNNNNYGGDGTGFGEWTAGSQRSDNGGADSGNHRAGRVFVEFVLTDGFISAAQAETPLRFTFSIDSIGQGVAGTPYTNGLDLRYLGITGGNKSVSSLWNTGGVGGDQADLLLTTGSPGTYTVDLANANILTGIRGASAGQWLAFGLSNSSGVDTGVPVGNSTAETYGFQTSQVLGDFALSVYVPEPSTLALIIPAIFILTARRLRRRR